MRNLDDKTNRRLPSRWQVAGLAALGLVFALPITAVSQSSPEGTAKVIAKPQVPKKDTKATDKPENKDVSPGAAKRLMEPSSIPWKDQRIDGYGVIRGRVVDALNKPVPGVDVGTHWEAFHGDLSPIALVVTDDKGQFEIPSTNVVIAMDNARKTGGIAIIQQKKNGADVPEDRKPALQEAETIDVEITLEPLADVRGSYWTAEAGRRPASVWTIIQRLPEEIQVIEQRDETPYFSFRLPPGKYRLRGTAANFEDVYRDFTVEPKLDPVELLDLPLPVKKLASLYGEPAPEIHLTGGQGIDDTAKLSDYHGKWVVLEFWGAWCGPCFFQMEQFFMFSEAHAKDRDRFEIITIHRDLPGGKTDLDVELPKLLKRWKRDDFPYPIAVDATNEIFKTYDIKQYPTTVVIDPEGRVTSIPGVWELSEILKGHKREEPELFQARLKKSEGLRRPAEIKPSNEGGGVFCSRFVAFNGHTDWVWEAEFLPDGKHFVTASSDVTLRFWNVESRTQTRLISCMTEDSPVIGAYGSIRLFMAQDGNLIGGQFHEKREGKLVHFPRIWRADTNFEKHLSLTDSEIGFSHEEISRNGERLAAYAYNPESKTQSVRIYDLSRGTMLHELDVHGDRQKDSSSSGALKFSPDGRYLAVSGDKGRSIQMWDVQLAKRLWKEQPADVFGVNSISFAPDGQTVACATWSEPVEIRSTMTGTLIRTLRVPNHRPLAVAMSPTGRLLATAGNSPPRIKIWDTVNGQIVGTLAGHPTGTRATGIAWSPDGTKLVSVAGANCNLPGEVLLWDLANCGIVESP